MSEWMGDYAADEIESYSPSLARHVKTLLEMEVTPAEIMREMRKTILDGSILGLLELAIDHWKGESNGTAGND